MGECLVDDQMKYKVGETIRLKSGTDDKVTDTLKVEELKVVGKGEFTVLYSIESRKYNNRNGYSQRICSSAGENISSGCIYGNVCAGAGGGRSDAYTGAYKQKVKTVKKRLKAITEERGKIRKEELLDKANTKH